MIKRNIPLVYIFMCTNLFSVSFVFGQVSTAGDNVVATITPLALVGTNASTISMTFQPVTTAGAKFGSVTNSSLYLRLTSHVPIGTYRKITVRKLSGSIPNGTQITIQPSPSSVSNSGGALGNAVTSPVLLSDFDQNLITNIGSCYTGTGATDGYRMTFVWSIINSAATYGQLTSSTYNAVIVFTVTAPE